MKRLVLLPPCALSQNRSVGRRSFLGLGVRQPVQYSAQPLYTVSPQNSRQKISPGVGMTQSGGALAAIDCTLGPSPLASGRLLWHCTAVANCLWYSVASFRYLIWISLGASHVACSAVTKLPTFRLSFAALHRAGHAFVHSPAMLSERAGRHLFQNSFNLV
jgi:hypothetical protein